MNNNDEDESEAGRALHNQLLSADPVAPADTAERYLPLVFSYLKLRNPSLDPHLLYDAATQAVLTYIQKPRIYDPSQKSLSGFLQMAAQADLLNLLAKERRHTLKNVSLDNVALSRLAGNKTTEEDFLDRQEALAQIRDIRRNQNSDTAQIAQTELDQKLLALWYERERRTERWAAVLGIQNLPVAEQRKQVKQHKDRLSLRLKRFKQKEPPGPKLLNLSDYTSKEE